MRLLFDENLSPGLPRLLETSFPGSRHVRECGLLGRADGSVWDYAQTHDFAIVSKDSDFYHRSMLQPGSPKLIWLRIGNCTTSLLAELLLAHAHAIDELGRNPHETVLAIS